MAQMRSFTSSLLHFLPTYVFSLLSIIQITSSAAVERPIVSREDATPLPPFAATLGYVKPYGNIEEAYYIPVKIGGKTYQLHLDTGGGAPWVLSTLLLPRGLYPKEKEYIFDLERCSGELDATFQYGDDTVVKGAEAQETIAVETATLMGQPFVAAGKITPNDLLCLHTPVAGNFGLGRQEKSWVRSAYDGKKINPIFTLDLHSEDGTSQATFSQTKDHMPSSVTWFSLDDSNDYSKKNWVLKTSADESGVPYVVDSGTVPVVIPTEMAQKYFDDAKYDTAQKSRKKAFTGWVVDCEEEMVDFDFKLGNLDVHIPGDDLIGPPLDATPSLCKANIVGYNLAAGRAVQPFYMLGLTFIKQFLVSFDQEGDGQIGIVPRSSSQ